jgi:hypothetical protein
MDSFNSIKGAIWQISIFWTIKGSTSLTPVRGDSNHTLDQADNCLDHQETEEGEKQNVAGICVSLQAQK